jgi:hypothetical protein
MSKKEKGFQNEAMKINYAIIKAMKSRDGFAATLALIIVFIVAVIGAIVYVHYTSRQPAPQNNTAIQSSSTVSANAIASPTATVPIAPPAAAGPKSCSTNNLNCLIIAAANCSPAAVEWTQTITLLGVYNQTSQIHLALNGLNSAGKCSFSDRTDSLTLSLTSQAEQSAKAQGMTDAQIQQQLQAAQTQASKQSVGTTVTCALATKTLVEILTNWSKGVFSSSDLASGSCTATLPNGAKTPLSTGGSVQFTPSSQPSSQPTSDDTGNTVTAATPPSGVGTATVYLYANETITSGNIEFKVNTLTASQLNVTITNQTTGQSQTVSLTPNDAVTVVGHDIMVMSIAETSNGTVNGQPIYSEEATVNYN